MLANTPTWWTDDRVDETVDYAFICSHLRPDEKQLLHRPPSFAAGLTDDTYLDWILERAKRFFLILVDVGVPDQIFGIVDDSFDDDDLPMSEEAVSALRLSYEPQPALDRRFHKAQFRYLIRVVQDGEHIRYAEAEIVPVYPLGSIKSAVIALAKDGTDKVRLPSTMAGVSKFYWRKRIALDEREALSESALLTEVASVRKYAHQHIMSIFGSYTHNDNIFVLYSPAPEWTLRSFLSDMPKIFDNLPKSFRRETMINWTHCLAGGLAWLHTNGRPHGLIRPSNVHIDDRFNICLGQFDDLGPLATGVKGDDIEAYQYAAPERWKRAITTQVKGPGKLALNSGGRTTRKASIKTTDDSSSGRSSRKSWSTDTPRLDTAQPTSIEYSFMPIARGNLSRLHLSRPAIHSAASDETTSTSSSSQQRAGQPSRAVSSRGRHDAPSALSNVSSESNRTVKAAGQPSVFVAAPDIRTARVQTWQSAQYDLFAADMFSMGAIILDILTVFCKKSIGSFSRHRSSKNRQAGRGGGLADASFHANIGQVVVWATALQEEATRRAKKDDGHLFRAVGPILTLVKRCMEREPDERLGSRELERRLQECITVYAHVAKLHCETTPENMSGGYWRSQPTPSPTLMQQQAHHRSSDSVSTHREDEITQSPPRRDEWAKLRSQGLTTATIPTPGTDSSISSLSSFNFDRDMASETMVGDDTSTLAHKRGSDLDALELQHRLQLGETSPRLWKHWHNNDSSVDPRLHKHHGHVGFTYDDDDSHSHSISPSSEGGLEMQSSFLLPESRPTSLMQSPTQITPPRAAPQGPLPPVPQERRKKERSRRQKASRMSADSDVMQREWPSPPAMALPLGRGAYEGGFQSMQPSSGVQQRRIPASSNVR